MHLTDYKVRIINGSDNTAAITRVMIESTDGKTSWTTVGAGDNIISASMIALVDSIEHMLLIVNS
jgi:2-isopropylmalate synthase